MKEETKKVSFIGGILFYFVDTYLCFFLLLYYSYLSTRKTKKHFFFFFILFIRLDGGGVSNAVEG